MRNLNECLPSCARLPRKGLGNASIDQQIRKTIITNAILN